MKIQLRSLRVINCGPLDDVCIDLCDASGRPQLITVIGGANGSGKTTVLELIFALCGMLDQDWNDFEFPVVLTVFQKTLSKAQFVQVELLIDDELLGFYSGDPGGDWPSTEQSVRWKDPHFDRVYGVTNKMLFLKIKQAIKHQQGQSLFVTNGENHLTPVANGSELLPSVLYFPIRRFLAPTEGKQIQREDTVYHWTYRYEPAPNFAGSLDSYLIWLDYAEPERFGRAVEFLAELDLNGKRFSILRKELRAVVTTQEGKTHGLEALSSGEQQIVIMLLELHRRLLPHGIVLIDEIENSLHPAFQYHLAQQLKRMQTLIPFQLIVTTHAPAFVEIFGPESVRLLTEF